MEPEIQVVFRFSRQRPILSITKTCPCNIQIFFFYIKNDFLNIKMNLKKKKKKKDIFNNVIHSIDCGYTFEPRLRCVSND